MTDIDALIELYEQHKFMYGRFLDNVHSFFLHEPSLNQPPLPVIHSLKWRLKDPEHLRDKLQRKLERGDEINEQNLFEKITDFAGYSSSSSISESICLYSYCHYEVCGRGGMEIG